MTEREGRMIAAYIPSPPDPELGFMDYYMLDSADRVIRVHAVSIAYDRDEEILEVVRKSGTSWAGVHNAVGECGSVPGYFYKWALYDNKEDCRAVTHLLFNGWEELREVQRNGSG